MSSDAWCCGGPRGHWTPLLEGALLSTVVAGTGSPSASRDARRACRSSLPSRGQLRCSGRCCGRPLSAGFHALRRRVPSRRENKAAPSVGGGGSPCSDGGRTARTGGRAHRQAPGRRLERGGDATAHRRSPGAAPGAEMPPAEGEFSCLKLTRVPHGPLETWKHPWGGDQGRRCPLTSHRVVLAG